MTADELNTKINQWLQAGVTIFGTPVSPPVPPIVPPPIPPTVPPTVPPIVPPTVPPVTPPDDNTTIINSYTEYEEIHVHSGKTLEVRWPAEVVRKDVAIVNPDHTDGGIVVDTGGTFKVIPGPNGEKVIFRSANPNDPSRRGHIMFHDGSTIQIDGAKIIDMGRTRIDPIGPTNPLARYALHFHLANNMPNCYIRNCEIYDTVQGYRHGIVIHGPNKGLIVHDNHIHHKGGTGIYGEDGTEEAEVHSNIIEDGYGTGGDHTQVPSRADARSDGEDRGFNGSGIYCRGPLMRIHHNTIRRWPVGITYYQFFSPTRLKPITLCEDNTIEDCYDAFTPWAIGGNGNETPEGPSTFSRFVIRGGVRGVFPYEQARVTFDSFQFTNAGIQLADYRQADFVIKDSIFAHSELGVSSAVGGEFHIDGCMFDASSRIGICTMFTSGAFPEAIEPRITRIINCSADGALLLIVDSLGPPRIGTSINLTQLDQIFLEEGSTTKRVYANYQHPTAPCPQTTQYTLGVPAPGLTNQQAVSTYGVCRGGELMPTDAMADTRIVGGKIK